MWDIAWVPASTRVVDRPELLVLAADSDAPYLNTVLRTRAPAQRLHALVDEVALLHQGQRSRWCVTDTTPTDALEATLTDAGYALEYVHHARLVDVTEFRARAGDVRVRPSLRVLRVRDEATLRDCWTVMDESLGARARTDEDLTVELAACSSESATTQRYVAYIDDAAVSTGGINLYPQLNVALLWGGGTIAAARGLGAYSAVVAARLAKAKQRQVRYAGLYAREHTSSPIVAKQGFTQHGTMSHFARDISG